MLNLMAVEVGVRLRLRDGSIREVLENFGDGIWLHMRVVEFPNSPAEVGSDDAVHCEEIVGIAG